MTNPFRTSRAGLTAGFWLWLRVHIPGYSVDIDIQVHCEPGNQIGHRVQYWVWRSNYFAPKSHRAHTHALTRSSPATPLVLCHPPWRTDKMANKGTNPPERIGEDQRWSERIREDLLVLDWIVDKGRRSEKLSAPLGREHGEIGV